CTRLEQRGFDVW
nr:immunoglobulin heavy chain junction region [Macaca mulatta]MOW19307.1 immunoglobulin heavy chain junction region [Macaca mulatta]MOW19359.1 immunoglobulin heavy chain junction region [Macaca mulatta]MOW19546.1 immunoglobulin heavy chain junction region [Macaca mulatta]MOW19754.1 immunoglobulin heavy chain junction region [Macaca mulatta]